MKKYGFSWKISKDDTMERISEFEAISEENAKETYKKWIRKNSFVAGEFLGELETRNERTILGC